MEKQMIAYTAYFKKSIEVDVNNFTKSLGFMVLIN